MYTLLKSLKGRSVVAQQLGVLLASFVIAELFYKFHSFTLECAAFLATWYALDLLVNRAHTLLASGRQ
jgi:hypothetical protein